nr:uracil-DNA glycosylase family protein [Marinicella sp. W31]MDC2876642.1 uracil-DNA glycosylase family protein [Marinicella sp. W31]
MHKTGIPFNDRSGDRLRDWMGVERGAFYDPARFAILPVGFCFPGYDARGSDLPPRPECAPQWRERAMASMPQIELVLAIGMYAQKWHMGAASRKTLTQTVHNWREGYFSNHAPRILPLPHPSWRNTGWLKKNPWFEQEVLPELKVAIRLYGGG